MLHPTAVQGSLRFGRGGTRRPEGLLAPTHASSAARSHPSKLSPRWQPCRITTTVASAAFAETLRALSTSRPTLACSTLTWTAQHAYVPTPSRRRLPPPKRETRRGPPTDWHRRLKSPTLPRPHRAPTCHDPSLLSQPWPADALSSHAVKHDRHRAFAAPRDRNRHERLRPARSVRESAVSSTFSVRLRRLKSTKPHSSPWTPMCEHIVAGFSQDLPPSLGNRLLDCWKMASHPCK